MLTCHTASGSGAAFSAWLCCEPCKHIPWKKITNPHPFPPGSMLWVKNVLSIPEMVSEKNKPRASWGNLKSKSLAAFLDLVMSLKASIKLMSRKELESLHLFLGHWFALCFYKALQQGGTVSRECSIRWHWLS